MSSLTSNLYEFGEFHLDAQSRVLRRGGTAVALTPKAFDVLLLLIQNAGRIVTKDELMKGVWAESFVEESNLTQTIFMVRKALDETADRRYILTVQGQGYRFLVPVIETPNSVAEIEAPEIEGPVRPSSAGSAPRDSIALAPATRQALEIDFIASAAVAFVLAFAIWSGVRGPVWLNSPAEPCWLSCRLRISPGIQGRNISAMG